MIGEDPERVNWPPAPPGEQVFFRTVVWDGEDYSLQDSEPDTSGSESEEVEPA